MRDRRNFPVGRKNCLGQQGFSTLRARGRAQLNTFPPLVTSSFATAYVLNGLTGLCVARQLHMFLAVVIP